MRIGTIIGTAIVIIGVLFVGANGYLPVPAPIRHLWDQNYEKNVEPAKEKWEEMKRKAETPTPTQAPNQANLNTGQQIVCTVPMCAL